MPVTRKPAVISVRLKGCNYCLEFPLITKSYTDYISSLPSLFFQALERINIVPVSKLMKPEFY